MPALEFDKHERYCQEYMIDLNRIAAVMRTGCYTARTYVYEGGYRTSDYTEEQMDPAEPRHRRIASGIASKLHSYEDVVDRINELKEERNKRVQIECDDLFERCRHFAFDFEPTGKPTVSEMLAALDKMCKHKDFYSEENKAKANAVSEMFRSIFESDDVLPKLENSHDGARTDTEDTTSAG